MTPDALRKKQHFYFCILIALKLAARDKSLGCAAQKNLFLLKWLQRAKTNALFSHDTQPEIDWLKRQILCSDVNRDPEPMLEHIYRTAQALAPVALFG